MMKSHAVKVLVTFAVETEFAPWRRLRDFHRTSLDAIPVYEGRLGAAELRVVLTGIGPRHATGIVRAVLSDAPDLCISSGLAGALKPCRRDSRGACDLLRLRRLRHPKRGKPN